LVVNLLERERNAVQSSIVLQFANSTQARASIAIRNSQIFVLEFVSFAVGDPSVGTIERIAITVRGRTLQGTSGSATYELVIPPPGVSGSQVMRLYARPSTDLEITAVLRPSNNQAGDGAAPAAPIPTITVSLSGYYVESNPKPR
jgi:hypothetical protein